jgi:hypothetical protein
VAGGSLTDDPGAGAHRRMASAVRLMCVPGLFGIGSVFAAGTSGLELRHTELVSLRVEHHHVAEHVAVGPVAVGFFTDLGRTRLE